jgi:hypothetical protein
MKKGNVLLTLVLLLCVFAFRLTSQTVYVSESGKKYHAKNCSAAKTGKKGLDLSAAIKQGYEACKICKAHEIKASTKPEIKSKNKNK